MKKYSLKTKIIVWFSAAIILVSLIGTTAVLSVSRFVIQKEIRDTLISAVEDNADEVEYYAEKKTAEFDDPYDIYIEYKNGYLEIDDDFIKQMNGITTSLFDENGLIYGDNSLFKSVKMPPYKNKSISKIITESGTYYIYDIEKKTTDNNCYWMRGTVSAESGLSQVNHIAKLTFMIIPILIALAIIGGYIIARKALAPVSQINDAAQNIREGNDLSKRIVIGEGNDELHSIANSFNEMFERLEKSFEQEQQLTSDISHELRTPVTVISSQCQYTLESERTTEEYIEAIRLISRQSRKMSSIINDMLSFARLERNADSIEKEKMNLSECVETLCEDMSMFGENNITLKHNIEPDIFIDGNFELISRMTANLISNAYRYGKENGHIFVSLKNSDGKKALCVEDDGIGISEEAIDKIWNRFYRGDASRSTKGTGLGLSFVKEIASIHNAEISVESELKKGSKFFISF